MVRQRSQLLEPRVEEFLRQPHVAVLSTVSPSGRPHASAVWYAYEDGALWINVGADSRKARNMRAQPDVALTIDERAWPYKEAVIYGRAVEVEFADEQARSMAVRHLGARDGEAMHRYMMQNVARVRFRLEPTSVHWQDFGE